MKVLVHFVQLMYVCAAPPHPGEGWGSVCKWWKSNLTLVSSRGTWHACMGQLLVGRHALLTGKWILLVHATTLLWGIPLLVTCKPYTTNLLHLTTQPLSLIPSPVLCSLCTLMQSTLCIFCSCFFFYVIASFLVVPSNQNTKKLLHFNLKLKTEIKWKMSAASG